LVGVAGDPDQGTKLFSLLNDFTPKLGQSLIDT
jgi:hypothetical protein